MELLEIAPCMIEAEIADSKLYIMIEGMHCQADEGSSDQVSSGYG
jgi:hypothetical protein